MEEALFRHEVVDARRQRWLGEVRLATPVSHAIWTLAALALAALIVLWLCLGRYTRREHVSGILAPLGGLISVTASSSGVVTQVRVAEGDHVRAGQRLALLSGERASATLGDAMADVSAQLRTELGRLQNDEAGARQLASQQAAALAAQAASLRQQLIQLDAQLGIQKQQTADARAMLERIEPLGRKGYVSALRIEQQKATMLDAQAQEKALARQRSQIAQQWHDVDDQRRQLPITTRTKLNDLERQQAQVRQSLAQNEADRSTVLRAPKAGTVSSLLALPGQALKAGQALLAIVPDDSPLQAQLLVPSSAVGFVRRGQAATLRYQAFPYQKFGLQRGQVVHVSRNALTPMEVAALVGETPQESLYRVQVALPRQSVRAYGNEQPLKSGMAVNADLLLDHRRLIEWLFEPLLGIRRRMQASPT